MAILQCLTELELLKIVSAFVQFPTNGGWRFFNSKFLVDSGDDKILLLFLKLLNLASYQNVFFM